MSAGEAVVTIHHQSSPVFTSLLAAVEVMLCRRNMTSTGGDIADLKNENHIPMSPKDKRHTLGMTVEKVSFAVLALFGVVGLRTSPRPPLGSCQSSACPDAPRSTAHEGLRETAALQDFDPANVRFGS
jgi:hypothetical protein